MTTISETLAADVLTFSELVAAIAAAAQSRIGTELAELDQIWRREITRGILAGELRVLEHWSMAPLPPDAPHAPLASQLALVPLDVANDWLRGLHVPIRLEGRAPQVASATPLPMTGPSADPPLADWPTSNAFVAAITVGLRPTFTAMQLQRKLNNAARNSDLERCRRKIGDSYVWHPALTLQFLSACSLIANFRTAVESLTQAFPAFADHLGAAIERVPGRETNPIDQVWFDVVARKNLP